MSIPFAIFIGVCYIGFMASCLVEGRYAWAVVGLCWGMGNMAIAYVMYADS
jgi:hypothetical protein